MTTTGDVQADPGVIVRYAPTTINALAECKLRVALMRSGRARNRPTTFTALGHVAHRMHELDVAGAFDGLAEEELSVRTLEAWDGVVADEDRRLSDAYGPPGPPPPRDWPGYAMTKSRTLRLMRRARSSRPASTPRPQVEVELSDERTGLHGRLDRLERVGGSLRVVDLKSGAWQDGMTDAQRRQLLLYGALVHASTGEWPDEVAIEHADGSREVEAVSPEAITASQVEAHELVDSFNALARRGWDALEEDAAPSDELCRRCPARLPCRPYWAAMTSEWAFHGAVGGLVTEVVGSRGLNAVRIRCGHPTDARGRDAIVYAVPTTPKPGTGMAVVGCDRRGEGLDWRFRWDADVALDDDFQAGAVGAGA